MDQNISETLDVAPVSYIQFFPAPSMPLVHLRHLMVRSSPNQLSAVGAAEPRSTGTDQVRLYRVS